MSKITHYEIKSIRKNCMGTLSIVLKVSPMRKPEEFTVYPLTEGEKTLKLQSNNRCILIKIENGLGALSTRMNHPMFDALLQGHVSSTFRLTSEDLEMLKQAIRRTAGEAVGDNSLGVLTDNSGARYV